MSSGEKKLSYEWKPSRFWYVVIRAFFTVVFHTIWPVRVRGLEHVPRKGAAIIVCNHLSLVDPFVVGYAANRIVNFMGKEELFGTPIIGFLIRKVGAFPVDRTRRDPSAMRTALQVLKSGELLGMFPEGTRSTTGEMLEFRAGAARLAARTEVSLIPAAVHNTGKAMPPGKLIRPARIGISFGEPFDLSELYNRNDRGEAMDRALQTIKERIEALAEP